MNSTTKLVGKVVAAALLASAIALSQTERSVMLVVNNATSGWSDGELKQKVERLFYQRNGFLLVPEEKAEATRRDLEGRYDKKELLARGAADRCRYILWCDVVKEELRLEKNFAIPFLVSQRRIKGILEVDYRVLDCQHNRQIMSKRIAIRAYGPSALQCIDYTDADPALQMSYSDKKELFDKLESEAAAQLMLAFADLAKQR